MASKLFRKTLAARPAETKLFIQKYLDFVLRLEAVRTSKSITHQQLADLLQISVQDWLSGDYALTLKTIVKLETFLQAELITIPSARASMEDQTQVLKIVHRSRPPLAPPVEGDWFVTVRASSTPPDRAIAL
jgi:hypothetical protein